jgi:hypothetical protein
MHYTRSPAGLLHSIGDRANSCCNSVASHSLLRLVSSSARWCWHRVEHAHFTAAPTAVHLLSASDPAASLLSRSGVVCCSH